MSGIERKAWEQDSLKPPFASEHPWGAWVRPITQNPHPINPLDPVDYEKVWSFMEQGKMGER
jgi:hypothetical protein